MFILMKSRSSSNMGHLGLKTRSLGLIIEKPCVCNRGCNFPWIFVKKNGQNVCLDEI